jgi:chorismate dehydratase
MPRLLRIAASSYSNTAPLIWSFLYGSQRGRVEVVLDNAPARSAELLETGRVNAALVPVIAYRTAEDLKLVSDVCIGTKREVRSVRLVSKVDDLARIRTISLDRSSRTSAALIKVIFREFVGCEPVWRDAEPDLKAMLADSDAALLIGDPALRTAESEHFLCYDLAGLWHEYTGLGFVFAMWMTRDRECPIDFTAARDEGVEQISAIAANYVSSTGLTQEELVRYLTKNVSFSVDQSMEKGMQLYFELAAKHALIPPNRHR